MWAGGLEAATWVVASVTRIGDWDASRGMVWRLRSG